MEGYTYNHAFPRNCHSGDILLLGDPEDPVMYDIHGINDNSGHRQSGLYVCRRDDETLFCFWKLFHVNTWLSIMTPC